MRNTINDAEGDVDLIMNNGKSLQQHDGDERLAALHTNANAVRAIAAAVEGTLGPKGLDTMLVDPSGDVIITNDGVTILNKMDVNHPAARMVIQIARAQQEEIGDGTTTATIMASALVQEGETQISRGVPVAKVIQGVRLGTSFALQRLKERARTIEHLDQSELKQIAYIAGRENEDIADLVIEAAKRIGTEKLNDRFFKLSDTIVAHEGADNEVFSGVLLNKERMNDQMPESIEGANVLVIQDALEPEDIDDEALGTEIGFAKYLEFKSEFQSNLVKLKELGVNFIVVDRGVDPYAEEFCIDHGIVVVQRVSSKDIRRIMEHTGARGIKRTALRKSVEELRSYIGYCSSVSEDIRLEKIRIIGGKGKPMATVLVGASTGEVVGERERIARDSASAVQAAIRGGYLPGGGSVELFIAREVEHYRETIRGMEGFGVQAVANTLRKPLAQIVSNAGFNPLEKVEEVKAAQVESNLDHYGVDCDTGKVIDLEHIGVIDPCPVKLHALKAAGEVCEAILKIHTIIRMKAHDSEEEEWD